MARKVELSGDFLRDFRGEQSSTSRSLSMAEYQNKVATDVQTVARALLREGVSEFDVLGALVSGIGSIKSAPRGRLVDTLLELVKLLAAHRGNGRMTYDTFKRFQLQAYAEQRNTTEGAK
jgi:cytochrome c-type biogenesis protein CcmH/NrfF